tara:strand:+ start:218 stop:538 length:321 start_codon:yes stop_codon:yes gene_type:complete
MSIINTEDNDFQRNVLDSEIPVIADFWAEWCGPCKMIGPILQELSEEYSDKIKVVKIDVDKCSQTAIQFSVRSIPTLMIFENGSVKAQHIGALSKAQLKEFIDNNI